QRGDIQRRSSRAHYDDFAAPETIEGAMARAVRDESFGKGGEKRRTPSEVAESDRHHDLLRGQCLTIGQANCEFAGLSLHGDDDFIFELRHKSSLELKSVLAESFERDREPEIGVGEIFLAAEFRERERRFGVVER